MHNSRRFRASNSVSRVFLRSGAARRDAAGNENAGRALSAQQVTSRFVIYLKLAVYPSSTGV